MSGPEEQTSSRTVAGRYRLESVLGRGGMGVVWLAVDTLIERRVALKELRAPTGVAEGDEASFVERALREARNAGRLNHPSVVAVYDVIAPSGDDDGVYIVMEYVPSPTLAEVIDQEGALPAGRVATMGQGILDAVMAAHTMGIVHRDIKPGNVLVRDGDQVKLTDFGIALAAEDTRLTKSGVIGTHAYLAPECFDTGQAGPAADLWGLGATLFHAVAGRAPFERDTTTATLRAILFEDPPNPPCEAPLSDVITGLLTRPIEQRLTSDAARELLKQVKPEPERATPAAAAPAAGEGGQSSWEANATTVHPRPNVTPSAQPSQTWGQTTQPPAAHPSPYVTSQPSQPAAQSWGQPAQSVGPATASPYTTAGSTSSGPQTSSPYGSRPGGSWGGAQSQGAKQGNPNTPWIIGGAAAVVGVLILILVLASGGGGGGGSTSSPDGAVRGLMEAVLDGDCDRAADYVTANFGESCPENPEEFGITGLQSVETVSESGDSAVVEATFTTDGSSVASDGSSSTIPFEVVRVDGEWRVDGVDIDIPDAGDLDIPDAGEIPSS